MANTEPQAMTSERLEELRAVCFHQEKYTAGEMGPPDSLTVSMALDELLAEVERRRVRETALVEIALWVAEASETHATPSEYTQVSQLHFSGVGVAGWLKQKARVLLAAGEQAQGEA